MADKLFLPVVTGPTASGKTSASIELAKLMEAEIISADSMQVFKGLEVLSAAPTESEMQGIPHHLIGVAPPTQPFSAAIYAERAVSVIADIADRGKTPILCGGTGLYIDAVTRPMSFSESGNEELRTELHAIADKPGGREKLHSMLAEFDPDSAKRLHPNDVRRVVRAIEVYKLTGITQTEQNKRDRARKGNYDEMIFALEWPRDELYSRIDKRVDIMVELGLLREVRSLMKLAQEHPTAIQAIGYKEIAAALRGEITLNEAILLMKQVSRNYAKRQITWFKRDERTIWIPASGRTSSAVAEEIFDKIRSRTHE